MKTILHLIETSGPGGAENMLINLVRNLDSNRYKSIICLLKDGWLNSQLQTLGFQTAVVAQEKSYDFNWFSRIKEVLRQNSVDLMHSHEFAMNSYGSILSCLTDIPIVATVHGKNYYPAKYRRRIAYFFVSKQARMVAVSLDLKNFLTKKLAIRSEDVLVIHNGIDPENYRECDDKDTLRKELDIPIEQPVIGTVGNLYPVKDHKTLLRAAAMITTSFDGATFLIAGRGQLLEELQREAASLGIEKNIRFLGFRNDIPRLLHAMDVFVLPSISEGLPLSVLEAMAAGRPVVASDVGGIREVITDGVTGFLIPPGAPEKLADKLLTLLHRPHAAASMGLAGRARIQQYFSVQKMVREYAALYAC